MLGALHVCTRSECRKMIRSVSVNGVPAKDPGMNVTEQDEICVRGEKLDTRLFRCLVMNKPSGILTAAEDSRARTVMNLLPALYTSLGCMPVGRLDKDTTGLLLFTTDGQLAHRLISPKNHVDKVYIAQVEGELDESDIAAFENGIPLKDFTAMPAKLEILSPGTGRVTVREGKYHQVKRMFGARGKPVTSLRRISFGPLELDEALPEGGWRELTEEEIALLLKAAGMEEDAGSGESPLTRDVNNRF